MSAGDFGFCTFKKGLRFSAMVDLKISSLSFIKELNRRNVLRAGTAYVVSTWRCLFKASRTIAASDRAEKNCSDNVEEAIAFRRYYNGQNYT